VGKPLAGKTGTSSEWFDAWFVGFSPDLVAGVYVGFDEPRTLGGGEVGGHVAAPIFRDFMAQALKDAPAKPFPEPPPGVMASARPINGIGNVSYPDDETQWGSLRPPSDEVTAPDGKAPGRDTLPPDWAANQATAAPYYGGPPEPDSRTPGDRRYGRSAIPAFAAVPPTDTVEKPADTTGPDDRSAGRSRRPGFAAVPRANATEMPADAAGVDERRYGRPQPPGFASAPPGYATQVPSDSAGTDERRYGRSQTSGYYPVPPAYAAPRPPAYAAPSPQGYPAPGMPTFGTPSMPGYGYSGPAPGPRFGTGGIY